MAGGMLYERNALTLSYGKVAQGVYRSAALLE